MNSRKKKIVQIWLFSALVIIAGGLLGLKNFIDYAPGLPHTPLANKSSGLSSSALWQESSSNPLTERGEEYYLKNSEQIDADLATIQAKIMEKWLTRYPMVAGSCDLVKIQESFDGNDKIGRTICKPNRVAGVIANRYLDLVFAYPDNRPVIEEMIALKWSLINEDGADDVEAQEMQNELVEYQDFLNNFTGEQYENLQKKMQSSNMNNSFIKGKYLGLQIAFLFAEADKIIIDYILWE